MKDFAKTYYLALLIGIFFSINSVAISVVSGLSGVDHWQTLTTTQRICIVMSIVASWTNVMLAFFNRTLQRIEAGKSPISSGHSDPPFKPEPKA